MWARLVHPPGCTAVPLRQPKLTAAATTHSPLAAGPQPCLYLVATDRQPLLRPSVVFCSGTTGTPKGVMSTHRNYVTGVAGARNLLVQARRFCC